MAPWEAEWEGEARENCWPLRERETETSVREVEEEETSVEWVAETSVEWHLQLEPSSHRVHVPWRRV